MLSSNKKRKLNPALSTSQPRFRQPLHASSSSMQSVTNPTAPNRLSAAEKMAAKAASSVFYANDKHD